MKSRSKYIIDSLEELYPDARCLLNHNSAFELLIAVILSAQTTDEKVNSVTSILFDKYNGPKALSEAKSKDVEDVIRPIGLYINKAKNIIETSKILINEYDGEVPNKREELQSLPGVGRKTANLVLNNCFAYPAFGVDTHVFRISKRLRIAEKDDDVLKVEEKLMNYFPKNLWGKLHHQFIFFGRNKCKAKKPNCIDCPFIKFCDKVS